MRTKTLALSALLGALGAASAVAQTNVYSINAVGYINVTLYPGYNLVTCPLVCSPNNTVSNLLNNTNGQYQLGQGGGTIGATIFQYINGIGYVGGDSSDKRKPGGWTQSGTNTLNPGQAIWFLNPQTPGTGSNMLATFVGQVPQPSNYNMTNVLFKGYNLVGSIIPVSGDLITNSISDIGTNGPSGNSGTLSLGPTLGDAIFVFDPTYDSGISAQGGYVTGQGGNYHDNNPGTKFTWGSSFTTSAGDPTIPTVYSGFWYLSTAATANNWVETFVLNP